MDALVREPVVAGDLTERIASLLRVAESGVELDLSELQRLARRPNVLEGHQGACLVSMMIDIVHFSRLARLEE